LKFDLGANARRQALEVSGGAATGTLGTVTGGDAALADAWSSASVAELDAGVEYSKPFFGAGTIAKMPGTYPIISSFSLCTSLKHTHALSHTRTHSQARTPKHDMSSPHATSTQPLLMLRWEEEEKEEEEEEEEEEPGPQGGGWLTAGQRPTVG
jgi:hypothetical protein